MRVFQHKCTKHASQWYKTDPQNIIAFPTYPTPTRIPTRHKRRRNRRRNQHNRRRNQKPVTHMTHTTRPGPNPRQESGTSVDKKQIRMNGWIWHHFRGGYGSSGAAVWICRNFVSFQKMLEVVSCACGSRYTTLTQLNFNSNFSFTSLTFGLVWRQGLTLRFLPLPALLSSPPGSLLWV